MLFKGWCMGAAFLLSSHLSAMAWSDGPYATYINFGQEDLLDGNDGLQPHPTQPLKYGPLLYPIDDVGNGRQQFEAHVTHYEGKYWMHSASWGCGHVWVWANAPPDVGYPATPNQAPGDYGRCSNMTLRLIRVGSDGNCGILTYSSADLTSWTLEDYFQPNILSANVTKPVVRYSDATSSYVMFMGGAPTSFWVSTGPTPAGPWSDPPVLVEGPNLSHDFDIAQGPDGSQYILCDPFQGSIRTPTGVLDVPLWPLWVMKLAPDLLSVVNTTETVHQIRTPQELLANTAGGPSGLDLEATGFFYNPKYDTWYITAGYTCQNCAGYIYYLYSHSGPYGPYKDGGFLTLDGCGGQNKGVMRLPSSAGDIFLAGNLHYRTGPTNLIYNGTVWHADNNQAASSTNFFPFEYEEDGRLKPLQCSKEVHIPLFGISESPAAPTQSQLDCSVRNWQNVEVSYDSPQAMTSLEFPVYQRTDNLGPTTNAGYKLDGPLYISLGYADGQWETFTYQSSNISWAPAKVSLMSTTNSTLVKEIVLSTNATNGCYGNLVVPNQGDSSYSTKNAATGECKTAGKAELYVYQW